MFGGWAEELLGLAAPRPHKDLDLLYPADSFALIDTVMWAGCGLDEITAKRLPHKRAFTRQAIMTELIVLRPASRGYVTDFRGEFTYHWPGDVLGTEIAGLRVASPAAVRAYRADHSRIHARKAGRT